MKALIRRVVHKESETERKKAERFTINKTFENKNKVSMVLYSIPDFVESKCICGKEGIGMDENMVVRCVGCIDKMVGNSTIVEMKTLVVPSIESARIGNAFEWNPQGNEQWYKVKGKNIVADSKISLSKEEIKNRFNEIMSKILADEPQLVEADYDKEKKILTIYV